MVEKGRAPRGERLMLRPSAGAGVEIFLAAPAPHGPCPAVLLVHGHQEPERPGGEVFSRAGDA